MSLPQMPAALGFSILFFLSFGRSTFNRHFQIWKSLLQSFEGKKSKKVDLEPRWCSGHSHLAFMSRYTNIPAKFVSVYSYLPVIGHFERAFLGHIFDTDLPGVSLTGVSIRKTASKMQEAPWIFSVATFICFNCFYLLLSVFISVLSVFICSYLFLSVVICFYL